MNTHTFERAIVSELIAADASAILAHMLELDKAQHIVDDICTLQDDAVSLFDAETERLTEREQVAQEADSIRDWLDTDSLPPAQQAALLFGDAVDLDEWQKDWQNTYNDLRGGL